MGLTQRKPLRRTNARQWRRNDSVSQQQLSVQALLEERLAQTEGSCYHAGTAAHSLLRPFSGGALDDAEGGLPCGPMHAEQIAEQLRIDTAAEKRPWYMIPPYSLFRKLWDTVALLNIYALLIVVPLEIAFFVQMECGGGGIPDSNLPDDAFLGASDDTRGMYCFSVYISVYFAVDICLNFLTGHYDENQQKVDYSLRRIAKRYARTHLATDVLACIPFNCIMTACDDGINAYNLAELTKLLRLFGMQRREYGSPLQWLDRVSEVRKEFSYQARRLVSVVMVVLEVAHVWACLLWLMLRVQHFPAGTWPVQLDIVDARVVEQWLWSFFCVCSAMVGLAWGSYPPVTWPEALLWVFCMITMASMWAVLNGFILSFILTSSSGTQEYKDKMDRLLLMLKKRRVPLALRDRIMDFMSAKYTGRRVAHDEEVLQELPATIRAQVALLSCGHLLTRVPLFARHPVLLEEVAPLLRRTVALPGQVILQQEHVLHSVVFIQRGFVDLGLQYEGTGGVRGSLLDTIGPEDHFAELALFPVPPLGKQLDSELREELLAGSRWRAPFTATALNHCELFELPTEAFQRVLQDHPEVAEELADEALRFLERVVATRAAEKAAAPQRPPNPPPPKGGDAAGGAMRSPRSPRPMLLGHIERSMTLPTLRPLRSFNGVTVDKGELAGGPGR